MQLVFVPGFFHINLKPIDKDEEVPLPENCPDYISLKQSVGSISSGFARAEEKKRVTWEKKQLRLKKLQELQQQ
jgi:hypothetical protein